MTDLPAPLVSPETDLRDYPYYPLDIVRLFSSEFHALANDSEFRAGITLWAKSFHQVPASSLPDDDISLARLAEFGRDLRSWRKVKERALHGWIKCDDGLLYHRIVSEKALNAWIDKLCARKASAAGNATRHHKIYNSAPFDAAILDALDRLATLNPHSRTLAKRVARMSKHDPTESPSGVPVGAGSQSRRSPSGSRKASHVAPNGSAESIPAGSQLEAKQELEAEQNTSTRLRGRKADILGRGRDTLTCAREDAPAPDFDPENPFGTDDDGPVAPPAPRLPQGTRLPGDWTLNSTGRDYAAGQGLSASEIEREASRFAAHWQTGAGADARRPDWALAWRTWARDAAAKRDPRGSGSQPERPTSGTRSALYGALAVDAMEIES